MKVAIVGSEDFQSRKTLLKVIQSILGEMHIDLLIPCGSADFEADLRVVARNIGVASIEPSTTNRKNHLRRIAELADLCLAFTSDGFAPEGKGYRIVQEFSDISKPVNVIQINANGNARRIMKLRYYRSADRAKSVSVMIVSCPPQPPSKTATRQSG